MNQIPGFTAAASLGRNRSSANVQFRPTHQSGVIVPAVFTSHGGHGSAEGGGTYCRLDCIHAYFSCLDTVQTPEGAQECRRKRDFCFLICTIKNLPQQSV